MQITLDLPDDLAARLNTVQDQIPQILEFGLRELEANAQDRFSGLTAVLEFLAGLPTPEETLALRPSAELQEQINHLLEKSRTTGLTPDEKKLWQRYEYTEHLVRIAKTKAYIKLNSAS
ncbi:hypothetical protein [cf. Phormidesmis sp. LEGE 11477]|uniref:hypothetical protein n=1 Tax=cf. Phormidesmis sp. LEGE 11477 TaxID=1828680 RepID=UPI00188099A0|nr:hypothetical protein [cf. Phormidesmis sp. LEGE 11477]MBE9060746.1 hypothetical protein [cf. Phormidesmis sp. LEGE 11477]